MWTNAWSEFVPFLQFDTEIRTIICTTNAIEPINARIRRAVNAHGHFPTEQAALKCIYLALMSLDPTGTGRKRWSGRWKKALSAIFGVVFFQAGIVPSIRAASVGQLAAYAVLFGFAQEAATALVDRQAGRLLEQAKIIDDTNPS